MLDTRDVPLYEVAEAAEYLHLDSPTLKNWMRPRVVRTAAGQQSITLLESPDKEYISFYNLVDAFVIGELHLTNGMALSRLYDAKAGAGAPHLFARQSTLAIANRHLFESGGGGAVAHPMLASILERIDYVDGLAARIYPFVKGSHRRTVFMTADYAFGRPVVSELFVSTRVLARRHEYGEDLASIAKAYKIAVEEVQQAIHYHQQA